MIRDRQPRRPKTLLTVDWDAFVPIGEGVDPQRWELDAESRVHINALWQLRGGLLELMKLDHGSADPFWAAMNARFPEMPARTLVSDSHRHVYPQLQDITTVILVDAHHDCWAGPKDAVDCSNWARVWLGRSRTRHIHWLVPDWVDASDYRAWDFVTRDRRITRHKLSDIIAGHDPGLLPDRVDRVHVCRSGCWTPPWLDQAFLDWLEAGGRECSTFPPLEAGSDWDALRVRWGGESALTPPFPGPTLNGSVPAIRGDPRMAKKAKGKGTKAPQTTSKKPAAADELDEKALEKVAGGGGRQPTRPSAPPPRPAPSLQKIAAGAKVPGDCAIRERKAR